MAGRPRLERGQGVRLDRWVKTDEINSNTDVSFTFLKYFHFLIDLLFLIVRFCTKILNRKMYYVLLWIRVLKRYQLELLTLAYRFTASVHDIHVVAFI